MVKLTPEQIKAALQKFDSTLNVEKLSDEDLKELLKDLHANKFKELIKIMADQAEQPAQINSASNLLHLDLADPDVLFAQLKSLLDNLTRAQIEEGLQKFKQR